MRSPVAKRFRRHAARRLRQGAWCDLCHATALSGQLVEWLDAPAFPERGPVLFVLCSLCATTNYADALNRLHRAVWRARHGGDAHGPTTATITG